MIQENLYRDLLKIIELISAADHFIEWHRGHIVSEPEPEEQRLIDAVRALRGDEG